MIRSAVLARRPVDARERGSIDSFVRLCDGLEQPFSEHASKVHVTASAIVVTDDRRRVLLHRHKRLGLWLQPGGHIDAGETPWDAALRETVEETGVPAVLVGEFGEGGPPLLHVDVHPGPRGHTHLDLRYLVESPHVPPAPPEGESQDVRWFHWHQAIDAAEPGLEGILRFLQPGEPRIRVIRNGDAKECAQVYLRSRAFGVAGVPVIHAEQEVRRWVMNDLIGERDTTVAEIDGTIVAMMVVDPGRKGPAWIEQLYLDPSWMGRGLGDRFMAEAKRDYPRGLQLWTFQVNEPARRFYERHGFVAAEFTDGSGNEERAPDVRYVWEPAA
jgi:8-oxo-dGTP pyrophosphatase MutT (NUDIX family)